MADTYTYSDTDNYGTARIQVGFDLAGQWFLKDKPMFKQYAKAYKPGRVPHPAETFTVTMAGQLAENTTPLDELTDIDAVAMPDVRQVSVTVNEYGSAVNATKRLILTSFNGSELSDANVVLMDNGLRSVDRLYQNALDGSSNVFYVADNGTLTRTAPAADGCGPFTARAGTAAVGQLRNRNAVPTDGTDYLAVVHPDISCDIRTEAGSAWVAAHTYSDTRELYKGEIGEFAGGRYVENTRCTNAIPGGGATERLYTSYYLGDEALLHAEIESLRVIVGPQTDKARRFFPLSWYAFFGVTRYRENAIERVRSTSSFGALTVGTYDPKA